MAFDRGLSERVREVLADVLFTDERRLFGGLAFFINGNMLCAVLGDTLAVRVGPAAYGDALRRPYAREMTFTGRPMNGFVTVDPAGLESDAALGAWLDRGIAFAGALPPK